MKPDEARGLLQARGVQADPAQLAATAVLLTALLEGTAERFDQLPLEAEPASFRAEQRRHAP
jgi:hypothetical protein